MNNFKFRASGLSEIMGDGKKDELTEGAKTYLRTIAKQTVYGFNEVISSKYMDKGIQCEDAAIELYNNVFFTNHVKNKERLTNDFITGECDILVPKKEVIDIKCAWSLATFPATSEEVAAIAKKSGYDWQGRAYMWLYDVPSFRVAYAMVSTPEELIKYEQIELHEVDQIDPNLRITTFTIERDASLEEKIKVKVLAAREYIENVIAQISIDHQG